MNACSLILIRRCTSIHHPLVHISSRAPVPVVEARDAAGACKGHEQATSSSSGVRGPSHRSSEGLRYRESGGPGGCKAQRMGLQPPWVGGQKSQARGCEHVRVRGAACPSGRACLRPGLGLVAGAQGMAFVGYGMVSRQYRLQRPPPAQEAESEKKKKSSRHVRNSESTNFSLS